MLLAEMLNLHGRYLKREIGFRSPRVSQWQLDAEKFNPLLPNRADYKDYEKHYRGAHMRLRDHRWPNKLRISLLKSVPTILRRPGRKLWRRLFARGKIIKKRQGLG